MSEKHKLTQSEIDGVQYRRAKLWQIILYACNGMVGMSVYSLIGLASYSASIGYGITTLVVGYILTGTRIFDAITDPMVAFLYDRINTKFGKLRIMLAGGFIIEAIALLAMFDFASSKGFGTIVFILLYCLYVIGYTITNMTAQTIPALLSNDPKQRPVIGVWTTAFNYLVPMAMSMVMNVMSCLSAVAVESSPSAEALSPLEDAVVSEEPVDVEVEVSAWLPHAAALSAIVPARARASHFFTILLFIQFLLFSFMN